MECNNCSSFLEERNMFYLLNCGHHICQFCVDTTTQLPQNSELKCFQCGADTKLKCLAKSLLVYPIVAADYFTLTHDACRIDEEISTPMYCLDCKETLCFHEAKSHRQQLTFCKHVVVTLDEFHRYQEPKLHQRNLGFLHPKSCMHHNRPFEFLDLETESHNRLVCSECECVSGNQASLSGLVGGASSLLHQKLEHIRELGCEGAVHLEELRKEEESFTSRLKGLEVSRDGVLCEIRRVFGSLHEALQTRQVELEKEVDELTKSANFALSEERDRCRVWQGQLSLLGKCVEEIQSSPLPLPSLPSVEPTVVPSSPSSLSLSDPLSSDFLNHNQKALMVDACLLEDALRNSLSSSRASSSLTDVQSQLRVSEIRDQLKVWFDTSVQTPSLPPSSTSLSFSPSTISQPLKDKDQLKALFHRISSMFSVTSSPFSPPPPPPSDWSKNKVQSVMTLHGKQYFLFDPSFMAYSPDSKLFYVSDHSYQRIHVFRNKHQAEHEGRLEIEFLPPLLPFSSIYDFRPSGICYHEGQLFIAETSRNRVQVWRAEDGSFVRMIGTDSGGKYVGKFHHPWGCTVYQNHLFVSEYWSHRIQKISLSDFSVVKVIGSQGNGLGQLYCPADISVFNDKLYVVDSGNHRISVFDPESGAALSVINLSLPNDDKKFSSFNGLCFSQNLLFVSSRHRISVFDSDHNYLYSIESQGDGDEKFSSLQGLLMVNDKLFVSDTGRIHVLEQRLESVD